MAGIFSSRILRVASDFAAQPLTPTPNRNRRISMKKHWAIITINPRGAIVMIALAIVALSGIAATAHPSCHSHSGGVARHCH